MLSFYSAVTDSDNEWILVPLNSPKVTSDLVEYTGPSTWIELDWYLWYSVLAFKSSMSMVGRPEMSSSSSCSVKMEISLLGMIS